MGKAPSHLECPESMWFCCIINILSSFTEVNSQAPARNPARLQQLYIFKHEQILVCCRTFSISPWVTDGSSQNSLGSLQGGALCWNAGLLLTLPELWDPSGIWVVCALLALCWLLLPDEMCVCVCRHQGKKHKTAEWSRGVLSKVGNEGHSWLFYWTQYSGFLNFEDEAQVGIWLVETFSHTSKREQV